MRKFCSYGPVNTKLHYYVPREALIQQAYTQLVGDDPAESGHYVTVWAPRQRGKSWVMKQVVQSIQAQDEFEVGFLVMQSAKNAETAQGVRDLLVGHLSAWFGRDFPRITSWRELPQLFTAAYFEKPLILILDEFDALTDEDIQACANAFRDMYIQRDIESHKPSAQRRYRLHGLALVGVRAVLGVENQSGSPFNVQRSIHIPNLTEAEVNKMYHWYERESGQEVEQAVIDRVYYETQGQPGLVSWLGELLTETYNEDITQPITLTKFEEVYSAAIQVLPNNNILNLISKARQAPYREVVLELFRSGNKIPFTYDDVHLNFLYLNGVIDWEQESLTERYVKFSCPLVQKRLFNYFARTLFRDTGQLYPPFEDLSDTITDVTLNVLKLLRRYEAYLRQNRDWLLKDAPRRADLRVREAVYHFNLYMYLAQFLQPYAGQVWPEFPTGNGKVDLIIHYAGRRYVVEVKSFSTRYLYLKALGQAAEYATHLGVNEIALALFIDTPVDDANRAKYEAVYEDAETGVTVHPVFVETAG
jgi:hypothetical protein